MKTAVLDGKTLGEMLDLSLLEEFGEVEIYENSAPDEIAARIADCDIAIVNKLKMNEKTIGENTSLKLICVFATGYDNIDLDFCRSRGIGVCNVVGYSTMSVAQLTASVALSLVMHLPEYTRCVSSGKYSAGGTANMLSPVYHELSGKTWGIAGCGNIGRAVGRIASALGCRVVAYNRSSSDEFENVGLDELCRESDIISVHLPLNDGTRGLFGKEEIAKMKSTALFINMARGAVTDETALAEAIKQGRLGGLGCDVYTKEPFGTDHPFYEIREYENVCFTPHMAWGALEARRRCLDEIILNIRSFLGGGRRSRVD